MDGKENKGNANERERFHKNIFICVIILKGDLKGFQENFETFFRIPPAVGRILPALGTNQIAGFVEYRPLTK